MGAVGYQLLLMSVTNIITRSARQPMAKQPPREVISLTEAVSAPVY